MLRSLNENGFENSNLETLSRACCTKTKQIFIQMLITQSSFKYNLNVHQNIIHNPQFNIHRITYFYNRPQLRRNIRRYHQQCVQPISWEIYLCKEIKQKKKHLKEINFCIVLCSILNKKNKFLLKLSFSFSAFRPFLLSLCINEILENVSYCANNYTLPKNLLKNVSRKFGIYVHRQIGMCRL